MLIECKHCGAPLDVKANQLLSKCAYCGTTSRVKSNRTVAFETPSDFRPPERWTPPAHVAADSGKTLVYHAANVVRRIVSLVITLAILAALIPGVIAFVLAQSASPDATTAFQAAEAAIQQAKQQAETFRNVVSGQTENLFEGRGPAEVVEKFRGRIGSAFEATRLVLYPSYAMLDARSSTDPSHVDRYVYRGGGVLSPEPVDVQSLRGQLTDHSFSLDDVALDRLPELIQSTVTELGYQNAKASHVIIERNQPFSKDVVIRIYVSGPRESGRIDYTAQGELLRAYE